MGLDEKVVEVKQSLGLYDIFGYILPGFFFFALIIIDYDCSKILRYLSEHKSLKGIEDAGLNFKLNYFLDFIYFKPSGGYGIVTFLIFIIFCYLTGHIISAFSSFMAKLKIKRFFRNPTENLFMPRPIRNYKLRINQSHWYRAIFVFIQFILYSIYRFITNTLLLGTISINYRKPFEVKFRDKFQNKINSVFGYEVSPKDYYWLVSSYINARHPSCTKNIKHFVNLSGFSRNIAGAFSVYVLLRISAHLFWGSIIDVQIFQILICYTCIVPIMIWSYMRLYKRQAVEMYYMFYSIVL